MTESLASLFWYALAVLGLLGSMLGASFLLGERHRDAATAEPYESGIVPTGSGRLRVPVQFYLIAMLFVIFDLEVVFLLAWAVVVREAGWLGFWEMAIFIGVLFVALIYVWRVGALDASAWSDDERISRRTG